MELNTGGAARETERELDEKYDTRQAIITKS